MSAPSELAVQRLPNLPISFFAMVMGLTGLTIAWEKAQHVFDIDLHVNVWLAGASAAVFILLLVLYTSKLARLRLRPTSRDRPFGKLGSDHRCRNRCTAGTR